MKHVLFGPEVFDKAASKQATSFLCGPGQVKEGDIVVGDCLERDRHLDLLVKHVSHDAEGAWHAKYLMADEAKRCGFIGTQELFDWYEKVAGFDIRERVVVIVDFEVVGFSVTSFVSEPAQ